MVTKYYELRDDVDAVGRWHLGGVVDGAGRELESREFTYGLPVDQGPPLLVSSYYDDRIIEAQLPLVVSLQYSGRRLDFTFAGFDVPVVTDKVAHLLDNIARADIQRIKARVEGEKDEYEIVNVVSRHACIDVEKSEIEWWAEEDGRPDKIGKPFLVGRLVIDPAGTHGAHIFRPEGWEVVMIVSDVVKKALERAEVTGVKFVEV